MNFVKVWHDLAYEFEILAETYKKRKLEGKSVLRMRKMILVRIQKVRELLSQLEGELTEDEVK